MKPLDLQVNGYAGTDFNRDDLTAEALHHACVCLLEDGCEGLLKHSRAELGRHRSS